MPLMTAAQAKDLADYYGSIVDSLDDYIVNPPIGINPSSLQPVRDEISDIAGKLYAASATLVMNDVTISLQQIKSVTDSMTSTIKTINDVQKIIDTATSIVNLGSAILSTDPSKIATALTGVVSSISAW